MASAQEAARSPGAPTVATDRCPAASTMPAYGWQLTDEEVAAVATQFATTGAAVTGDQVRSPVQ